MTETHIEILEAYWSKEGKGGWKWLIFMEQFNLSL